MRCQEIVNSLRGSLDLTAGPIAVQLDELYDFVLRRLMEGNMHKEAKPTEDALQVLRGLLEAWQELAARPNWSLWMIRARTRCASRPTPRRLSRERWVGAGSVRGRGPSMIPPTCPAPWSAGSPHETLAAALSPLSVRSIQQRLERILIDDRELLISLQCQLEQIRRELRLLNDDRIVRALDGDDSAFRH